MIKTLKFRSKVLKWNFHDPSGASAAALPCSAVHLQPILLLLPLSVAVVAPKRDIFAPTQRDPDPPAPPSPWHCTWEMSSIFLLKNPSSTLFNSSWNTKVFGIFFWNFLRKRIKFLKKNTLIFLQKNFTIAPAWTVGNLFKSKNKFQLSDLKKYLREFWKKRNKNFEIEKIEF